MLSNLCHVTHRQVTISKGQRSSKEEFCSCILILISFFYTLGSVKKRAHFPVQRVRGSSRAGRGNPSKRTRRDEFFGYRFGSESPWGMAVVYVAPCRRHFPRPTVSSFSVSASRPSCTPYRSPERRGGCSAEPAS